MGGKCSCMKATEPIRVDRDTILHAHHMEEDLKHWELWSQLDLHDEAKMFKLSVFMQNLMDTIVPDRDIQQNDLEMAGDIDLDQVKLHDVIHLEWPIQQEHIDTMIHAFEESADGIHIPLPKASFLRLVQDCTAFFAAQPNMIQIQIPQGISLTIVGDLHGQLQDLLHIFKTNGAPSATNWYLFNGDIVDRGSCSLEICAIILAFHSLYPEAIHLTRGNHEDPSLYRLYTFQREVITKYDHEVDGSMRLFFKNLPLCYVVNRSIFVVHGGLPANNITLDEITSIPRQNYELHTHKNEKYPGEMHLMQDLLWSDPQTANGHTMSKRGAGVLFGPDICSRFLQTNSLKLLVRSHEVVRNGFLWPYNTSDQSQEGRVNEVMPANETPNTSLLTIFSCSNYCNSGNQGAYIVFDSNLKYAIHSFNAKQKIKINMGFPAFRSIEDHNRHNILELIISKKPKLAQAFEDLDQTKSGKLTLEQWSNVMKQILDLDLDWCQLAPLFLHIESGHAINYRSFLDSYQTIYKDEKSHHSIFDSLYTNRRELEIIFCFFDTDNSGTISLQEFQRGCEVLNDHLPDEDKWTDPIQLFHQININGASTISINEFFEAFRIVDRHRPKSPQTQNKLVLPVI